MHVIKALAFTLVFVGVIPTLITGVSRAMGASNTVGLVYYGCGLAVFALLWNGMLLDSIDQTLKRIRASSHRLTPEQPES